MFDIADERYAVANAVDELKEKATAVIESNHEDGVARWLNTNFPLLKSVSLTVPRRNSIPS